MGGMCLFGHGLHVPSIGTFLTVKFQALEKLVSAGLTVDGTPGGTMRSRKSDETDEKKQAGNKGEEPLARYRADVGMTLPKCILLSG
jgi:hypothetical protein